MVYIDFEKFDDELRSMQELMNDGQIAINDSVFKTPLESLHLKKAVTVPSGASLKESINTMFARQFGCLLVVEKKRLCGIFTERDVLQRVAGQGLELKKEKIDDFMTPNPVMFNENDPIETALQFMEKKNARHLPIGNQVGEPVAILSVRDIIDYIVEFFPQEILNLPPHPIRLGTKNQYGG